MIKYPPANDREQLLRDDFVHTVKRYGEIISSLHFLKRIASDEDLHLRQKDWALAYGLNELKEHGIREGGWPPFIRRCAFCSEDGCTYCIYGTFIEMCNCEGSSWHALRMQINNTCNYRGHPRIGEFLDSAIDIAKGIARKTHDAIVKFDEIGWDECYVEDDDEEPEDDDEEDEEEEEEELPYDDEFSFDDEEDG